MTPSPPPPTLRTGKICYLEIPALDIQVSAAFYERSSAGTSDSVTPTVHHSTTPTGEVSGAWVLDRTPDPDPGILPYIMVADAAAAMESVFAAGGHIEQLRNNYL